MTNTNILQGLACPQCGNDSELIVIALVSVRLTDDEGEAFGDQDWDWYSTMTCPECEHQSIADNFRTTVNYTVCFLDGDFTLSTTVPAISEDEAIKTAWALLELRGIKIDRDVLVEVST